MRAVILAAGDGGRLGARTADLPKPLIPLGGRPLIAYTLAGLADAGVRDATVVTGYRGEQLRSGLSQIPGLPRLTFRDNPRFHAGASYSLRAARASAGDEPFLLLMADHLLDAAIVSALLSAAEARGESLIATDARTWPAAYVSEATRVRIGGDGLVSAIGKGITPYDALDTGAFLLQPEAWDAVDAAPEDCELSAIFSILAREGRLRAVDVSGSTWYDVDTAEDLSAAGRLLAGGRV